MMAGSCNCTQGNFCDGLDPDILTCLQLFLVQLFIVLVVACLSRLCSLVCDCRLVFV